MRAFGLFFLCFLALSVLAGQRYNGSLLILTLFYCSSAILVAMSFVGRFSYSYLFLALFLFLGFWFKFTIHTIFEYPFIEPVGDFDYSAKAWDRVLLAATTLFGGLTVARLMAVAIVVNRSGTRQIVSRRAPRWYIKNRLPIWLVYWLVSLSLFGLNYIYGYFKTGMHPLVDLPPPLSAILPFAVFIGLALVLAGLLGLEVALYRRLRRPVVLAVVAEGLLASVSMASRVAFLMHVVPFFVALWIEEKKWGITLLERKASLLVSAVTAFIGVLLIVGLVRIADYPRWSELFAEQFAAMAVQTAYLFTDRWVGLEGLMAATSYRDVGAELLYHVLVEDPRSGVNSLYQYIANSFYVELEEFTFLAIPGFGAVLFFGGSYFLGFFGALLIGLLLAGFERFVSVVTQNPFLVSLASAAVANALCQMNFPYLFLIFVLLLCIVCALLLVLRPINRTKRIKAAPSEV